jgi:putative ABC transport system permease protein
MLKSFFKIAWRSLLKDRQFTILNLIGLSTGLACTFLIYLWVSDELSMDRFHEKDSQLFQVMTNEKNSDNLRTIPETPALLARTLKEEMPEVEYAAAVLPAEWFGKVTLSAKGNGATQSAEINNIKASGHFADKDFFNVFSYHLLQGNKNQVLADKNSIVLSKELALKLFHTTDNLVGKTVEWEHEQSFLISGIFDGVPANSSDQFDYLVPLDRFIDTHPYEKGWGTSEDPNTYVVLKQGTNLAQFNLKIADFIKRRNKDANLTLFARPYSDGYLYGKYENGVQAGGRIEYVRLFSIIAIFILVIACINFMNLSTAKASKRIKEVGIKKCVGASRGELIVQYLGESMLMTVFSLILAFAIVTILLPEFNDITGKQLFIHFDTRLVIAIAGIALITGLLSGSYPALYISGFKPAAVLKGKLKTSAGELWVRKGLVVFQFALSVVFIISVMVVYKQIRFIQTQDPGYNKDNILSFDMKGITTENTQTFLSAVKNVRGVVNASGMDHGSLIADYGGSSPSWDGMPPKANIEFGNIGINYGMVETLGLQITKGRTFSRDLSSDSAEVILNQAAIDAMGLKDPIGKKIGMFDGDGNRKIVGIVKNFHFESMHEMVKPFGLRLVTQYTAVVLVKIKAGKEKAVVDQVKQLYTTYNPGFPFVYKFLDDDFQAQYVAEQRVAVLSRYFGGLAILISCLGLFGLSAFTAERRIKEIGIRKVLGATVNGVVILLSRDFLKLVVIAIIIAFPLAWWATNQWLNGFAYRTHIGAGVYLSAALVTMLITLLTISFQSVKAAVANPVKSLKSE